MRCGYACRCAQFFKRHTPLLSEIAYTRFHPGTSLQMLRFHKYYFSYSSLVSDLYSVDLAVRIYTKNNRYTHFQNISSCSAHVESILSPMTESQCLIPTSQSLIIIFVFVHLHISVAGICIQVCGFIPIRVVPACIWLPCSILAEDSPPPAYALHAPAIHQP